MHFSPLPGRRIIGVRIPRIALGPRGAIRRVVARHRLCPRSSAPPPRQQLRGTFRIANDTMRNHRGGNGQGEPETDHRRRRNRVVGRGFGALADVGNEGDRDELNADQSPYRPEELAAVNSERE